MIKIKWTSVFTFDVFYGEGWANCARFRILKGDIIPYRRYGQIPNNYLQIAVDSCKSRKLQPLESV